MQMWMLGFIHTEHIRKDFVFASYSIQYHKRCQTFSDFLPFFNFQSQTNCLFTTPVLTFSRHSSSISTMQKSLFHKSDFKCFFCALFHEDINLN